VRKNIRALYWPTLWVLLIGIVGLLPYAPANAAFLERDWKSAGDKLITLDTNTGLEWLDVAESTNYSFNYVNSQFGVGGDFEGFRYATTSEVKEFITNAGWPVFGSTIFSPEAYEPLSLVQSLVGVTQDLGYMRITTGATADLNFGVRDGVSVYVSTTDQQGLTVLGGGWDDSVADPLVGSWLVREAIREPRDLTGDGKADIVIRNMDTGYLFMWQMDSNLTTYLGISPLALTREVVGIADLTGDGKADILLRNKDNGYVYMWQMDGNLKTYVGISALGLNKEVTGVGDLTGDGKADIVLRNKDSGYVFMWDMGGPSPIYRSISALALNKEVVGIGDLTGDGKDDIVLRNIDSGYVFMWQMNGNLKTYLGISPLALTREVVGIADLTGDGKADIVLRNKDNNYLYMWEMDGNLKTYRGIGSLGPDRKVVQLSDMNGDGKADLVLRDTQTGYMELWEMDGNLFTAKPIGALALSREVQPSEVPSPVPAVEAADDSASTTSDKTATLSVLANDKPNPTALSITAINQPANGVVVDNGNGTLSYSQNGLARESVGMGLYKTYCASCHNLRGFSGTDTFSYVASDGRTSDSATVTVTVTTFDLAGASGDISGMPISVCADLPHTCKAPGDAEIQAIGRFLIERFAP